MNEKGWFFLPKEYNPNAPSVQKWLWVRERLGHRKHKVTHEKVVTLAQRIDYQMQNPGVPKQEVRRLIPTHR